MDKAGNHYDPLWQAVAKTLLAGADQAHVRSGLERIARDKLPPEELVKKFEERARNSEQLLQSSPVSDSERERLAQDVEWSNQQAKFHERLIGEPKKFRQQCSILWLWQQQGGGDPPITDRTDEPSIRFFLAATKMVFGKSISPGRAKKVIHGYRHKNFSSAIFKGESGWHLDGEKTFIIPPASPVKS